MPLGGVERPCRIRATPGLPRLVGLDNRRTAFAQSFSDECTSNPACQPDRWIVDESRHQARSEEPHSPRLVEIGPQQKKAGKLLTRIKLSFTPSKGKKQSKSLTVEFKK